MCDFCENSRCVAEKEVAYGYRMKQRYMILSNKRIISVQFESANELDTSFKDIDLKIKFCPNCGIKVVGE